jgi:hypothetical protein
MARGILASISGVLHPHSTSIALIARLLGTPRLRFDEYSSKFFPQ